MCVVEDFKEEESDHFNMFQARDSRLSESLVAISLWKRSRRKLRAAYRNERWYKYEYTERYDICERFARVMEKAAMHTAGVVINDGTFAAG